MKKTHYAVAVDGPSGAGKSTLAKKLAKELGIRYIDTGAIYRTIALAVHRAGVDPHDASAVEPMLPRLSIQIGTDAEGTQTMQLNGEDVTAAIRLPEISMYASAVSALPCVRAFLLETQRRFAREQSVIMDGRDIGTVVLPDAEVKIFLTADAEVRAKRRCLELEQRGTPKPYDEVLAELVERDRNDASRAIAPLKQAEDAVLLDTSALDFEQSAEQMRRMILEKTK